MAVIGPRPDCLKRKEGLIDGWRAGVADRRFRLAISLWKDCKCKSRRTLRRGRLGSMLYAQGLIEYERFGMVYKISCFLASSSTDSDLINSTDDLPPACPVFAPLLYSVPSPTEL